MAQLLTPTTLSTWNGQSISTATYKPVVIPGAAFDLHSQAVYVDRSEDFPYLSGAVLSAHTYTFQIILASSAVIPTAREALKGIFNITDFNPHALVGTDANGNSVYINGIPVALIRDPSVTVDTAFLITLAVDEPTWRIVTPETNTWNIATTGSTRTITPATPGNIFARPTFAITPTGVKPGTWAYRRYGAVYNRSSFALINRPYDLTNGGINTATLVNDTTVSNLINQVGGITAVATTIPIDTPTGGGLASAGMGYVGTEQITWTGNTGTSLTGVTRGVGGTTAATHPDNAVIARSKMLANGADIIVQVDSTPVDYWLVGMNTTATEIWYNQNYSVPQSAVLTTALANSGTPVTVTMDPSKAVTKSFLTALLASANCAFMIGSEVFTCTPGNISVSQGQITNCARAQKGTSFAAHSVGDTIIFLEHDVWLLYGNQNATAFPSNSALLPLLDLTASTNTSWVQTQFFDNTSARPAAWQSAILNNVGGYCAIFTGNQETTANPTTDMGMSIKAYLKSKAWKAGTGSLVWSFYDPCGITTVSMSGAKYAVNLTVWPGTAGIAGLQANTPNTTAWVNIWNESAAPTVASTWQSFTHNAVALGAVYNNIRLTLQGSCAATINNDTAIQGDTVTLALNASTVPSSSLGAEVSLYYLSATLTDTDSGNAIALSVPMLLNQTLTINTQLKTVTLSDGSNMINGLSTSSIRNEWMTLGPAVAHYKYDETGMTGVTVVTTWTDRTL